MPNHPSLLTQALHSTTHLPQPHKRNATGPSTHISFLSNSRNSKLEASPSTTSKPIPIPGRGIPIPRLEDVWTPVQPRIHCKADDVTDYYRTGSRGWEDAHRQRVLNWEKGVGRVVEGRWEGVRVFGGEKDGSKGEEKVAGEKEKEECTGGDGFTDSGCVIDDVFNCYFE